MEHFYQNINGWFDFTDLYSMFVDRMTDGSRMVEIGVWKGKSISYLGVLIKNSNKNIKIYGVDTWSKLETENYHTDQYFKDDALYKEFLKTIEPISDIVVPCRGKSSDISETFPDKYFDVVFIDACHDYECINDDIIKWLPKVKQNGIISGHDISFSGVSRAVNQHFKQINIKGNSWWVYT